MFVCVFAKKFPALASQSCCEVSCPRAVGEYEYRLFDVFQSLYDNVQDSYVIFMSFCPEVSSALFGLIRVWFFGSIIPFSSSTSYHYKPAVIICVLGVWLELKTLNAYIVLRFLLGIFLFQPYMHCCCSIYLHLATIIRI